MPDSFQIGFYTRKDNDKYFSEYFQTTLKGPGRNIKTKGINGNKITSREIEVLELLSNGDSAKIIAYKLHISETTAITHRKHLIQKLHAKNTAHLIKIAVLSKIIY